MTFHLQTWNNCLLAPNICLQSSNQKRFFRHKKKGALMSIGFHKLKHDQSQCGRVAEMFFPCLPSWLLEVMHTFQSIIPTYQIIYAFSYSFWCQYKICTELNWSRAAGSRFIHRLTSLLFLPVYWRQQVFSPHSFFLSSLCSEKSGKKGSHMWIRGWYTCFYNWWWRYLYTCTSKSSQIGNRDNHICRFHTDIYGFVKETH